MDVMGLRALICVLVVVGCVFAVVPGAVGSDAGPGGVEATTATVSTGESLDGAVQPSATLFQVDDEETNDGDDAGADDVDDANDADDVDNATDDGAGNDTDNESVTDNVSDAEAITEPALEGYDNLRLDIDVNANGSAAWTLEYQYRLDDNDDENESIDWEERREEIEEHEETTVEAIEERWTRTATAAANETERNMSVDNFALQIEETDTPHEYGYVRFTFLWSDFAHVELNRIEVGDAIEGIEIDDRTQLVVSWPESHNATEVEPSPDDRRDSTIIWNGEDTEFLDGEPHLVLMADGEERSAAEDEPGQPVSPPWLIAGGLVLLAVIGATGWLLGRGRGEGNGQPGPDAVDSGETAAHAEPTQRSPPMELLSNEERVLRLLEERGGRIKQQAIVSELEWTEAKTSQVVSALREDDRIDVFRIGRENVLVLPEASERVNGSSDEGER